MYNQAKMKGKEKEKERKKEKLLPSGEGAEAFLAASISRIVCLNARSFSPSCVLFGRVKIMLI